MQVGFKKTHRTQEEGLQSIEVIIYKTCRAITQCHYRCRWGCYNGNRGLSSLLVWLMEWQLIYALGITFLQYTNPDIENRKKFTLRLQPYWLRTAIDQLFTLTLAKEVWQPECVLAGKQAIIIRPRPSAFQTSLLSDKPKRCEADAEKAAHLSVWWNQFSARLR